jgi:hypothetical protein
VVHGLVVDQPVGVGLDARLVPGAQHERRDTFLHSGLAVPGVVHLGPKVDRDADEAPTIRVVDGGSVHAVGPRVELQHLEGQIAR